MQHKVMQRTPDTLKRIALRLLPAYVILSLVLHFGLGAVFLRAAMFVGEGTATWLHPEYAIHTMALKRDHVVTNMTVHRIARHADRPGRDTQDGHQLAAVAVDKTVRIKASLLYDYPVITLSLLAAWIFVPWRRRWKTIFWLLPAMILVAGMDLGMHVTGYAESGFETTVGTALTRQFWFGFTSNGGRQFLSLILFGLAVAPFHLRGLRPPPPPRPGIFPDQPCPCGSGRKHKNCCGAQNEDGPAEHTAD